MPRTREQVAQAAREKALIYVKDDWSKDIQASRTVTAIDERDGNIKSIGFFI